MKIAQFASQIGWSKQQVRRDFMAALVVTAIAVPESLGFAAIVGLPVQTGLYCALLAPIIFALLTSSKHLVIGADSATAALVASGAATIAVAGSPNYANAIAVLGVLTGCILLVMSVARFGFLADLISKPVFIGFLAGIGVQLMIGRLPEMLGLETHGSTLHKLWFVVTHVMHLDPLTAFFSIVIFAVVLLANKRHLPGSLIALISAIAATYLLGLNTTSLHVVGQLPHGLPGFFWPHTSLHMLATLLPVGLAIAIVVLVQSSSVIRNTAERFDEPVDDNRDLAALGAANIASALTYGFAVNGSPPRSMAGEMSGGRSQLVNIWMALLIGALLLFASKALEFLPMAALAVVVFSIGMHLFNVEELRHIYEVRRVEFGVALIALLGVALFGVEYGVAIAVMSSLLERLQRQYRPKEEILLRDGKLAHWASNRLNKNHKHRSAPPGLLVYRFSESIFFENASYFSRRVLDAVAGAKRPVETVILDAGAINDLDFTGAETLKHLCHRLSTDDIRLILAHVPPSLDALLERYHLIEVIGKNNIYPSLEDAIQSYPASWRSTIDMVRRLQLPTEQYVVIGGGVLEALGIRDTNDVDLVVNEKLYQYFASKGWREYIQDDGKHLLSHHGYNIMLTYVGRDYKTLKRHAFTKDGVHFMSLEDLVECKQLIARQKDQADIQLILDYQAKARQD